MSHPFGIVTAVALVVRGQLLPRMLRSLNEIRCVGSGHVLMLGSSQHGHTAFIGCGNTLVSGIRVGQLYWHHITVIILAGSTTCLCHSPYSKRVSSDFYAIVITNYPCIPIVPMITARFPCSWSVLVASLFDVARIDEVDIIS